MQGGVELGFCDQVLMHRVHQSRKGLALCEAALQVGPGLHSGGGGVGHVRREVMSRVHIRNGRAIAHDIAIEAPGVAQVLAQEHRVRAGRRAVDSVVGAHHRLRMRFGDRGAKGRQVGVLQVMRRDVDVELVPHWLRPAMHRVVLRSRDNAKKSWILPLHTGDKGDAHATRQERIFAVGLLPASPARIAEDVDVGRPEGQAEEHLMIAFAHGLVVLCAGLGGDRLAHAVDEIAIPCGGHADHLGEVCRIAGEGDAVEGFVPPIVLRHAEPRDGGRVIAHLRDLLFQCHSADEVIHAFVDGRRGIHERKPADLRLLADNLRRRDGDCRDQGESTSDLPGHG